MYKKDSFYAITIFLSQAWKVFSLEMLKFKIDWKIKVFQNDFSIK